MRTLAGIINMNSRFCRNGFAETIYDTLGLLSKDIHETYNIDEFKNTMKQICQNPPKIGFIAGGDGGLVLAISEYLNCQGDNKPIQLLYLPTGTNDKEGRDLGIFSQLAFGERRNSQRKKFLKETAHELKKKHPRLNKKKKNILKIETKNPTGEIETNYAFDFAVGGPVEGILQWYGLKKEDINGDKMLNSKTNYNPFGMGTTVLKNITNILSGENPYQRISAKMKFENGSEKYENEREDYFVVFVSTGKTALPFLKPFYLANNEQGNAHFVASTAPELKLVKYLPRMSMGYSIKEDPNTIETGIKKLELEFASPEVIHFAGEFRVADYVKVEVLQDKVEFIVPKLMTQLSYLENHAHKLIGPLTKRTFIPAYETIFDVVDK